VGRNQKTTALFSVVCSRPNFAGNRGNVFTDVDRRSSIAGGSRNLHVDTAKIDAMSLGFIRIPLTLLSEGSVIL
jgi:hypothetical protein